MSPTNTSASTWHLSELASIACLAFFNKDTTQILLGVGLGTS